MKLPVPTRGFEDLDAWLGDGGAEFALSLTLAHMKSTISSGV